MLGNLYQIKHEVVTYTGRLEDRYTGLRAQTASQKTLSKFSLFSCVSTKNTLK